MGLFIVNAGYSCGATFFTEKVMHVMWLYVLIHIVGNFGVIFHKKSLVSNYGTLSA
jgi:hypothetical protein